VRGVWSCRGGTAGAETSTSSAWGKKAQPASCTYTHAGIHSARTDLPGVDADGEQEVGEVLGVPVEHVRPDGEDVLVGDLDLLLLGVWRVGGRLSVFE
jgi:hypothetical protein